MSDQVLFSIGEVASIVGLSRHTIRAWERRHGFLRPLRTSSGQRRYTADDVALLLQVKHSTARHGLSLKVATRTAQGELSVAALQFPQAAASRRIDHWESEGGASASIWRSAANLLSQVIVILDVDGFVSASNRAASQLLGVAAEQMVGRRFADLLGPLAPGVDIEALLQPAFVLPHRFEIGLRGPEGLVRWTYDCRPFSHEGQPRVAVFGHVAGPVDQQLE